MSETDLNFSVRSISVSIVTGMWAGGFGFGI